MELVRTWIVSVVTVSMLLNLVRLLTPKGSVQKIASFTGGLILLLALLRPLAKAEFSKLVTDIEMFSEAVELRQEELMEERENQLRRSIEDRTAAYISDKAKTLGTEVSAEVKTTPSSEGIPFPVEAEIAGAYTRELAEYIEQDLGIPAERQVWCEDEN
jgi:stage III sporulation protein AF